MNVKTVLIASVLLLSPGAAMANGPAAPAAASTDAQSRDTPAAPEPEKADKRAASHAPGGQPDKPPTPQTAPAGVQPDKPA